MSGSVSLEYLASSPDDRRRPVILVTALVVVLAGVAVLILWWSASVKQGANERLGEALRVSSARVTSGEAAVSATLQYASPMIWSASVPEDVRGGLRVLVQDSAARVAVDLDAIRASAVEVTVLPWQGAQATARDHVIDVIDAEIARFRHIAADATAIGDVLGQSAPSTAAAAESLRASGANGPPNR
jgi:hypothetical protein